MMRKVFSIILAGILLLSVVAGCAETANEEFLGTWYMTQFVSGVYAFSCDDTGKMLTCDFMEDGTCDFCLDDEHYDASWMDNGDGTYTFMEEDFEVPIEMWLEDGYLMMGDEFDYYIFSREPFKPREFAKAVVPEKAADLNGKYQLSYLSGEGFTVRIDEADDLLEELGITDKTVNIDKGYVEFLGQIGATFDFDQNEGTLNLTYSYEGFEPQQIKIIRLDDGSIAMDWVGMTFYADPLTEEE